MDPHRQNEPHYGPGRSTMQVELPVVAPRESQHTDLSFHSFTKPDSNYGPHQNDRALITIIRAVLAENPYQVPKIERGPVWRKVIKRLHKEGLTTNIKVVRQRLRRNLRAHKERKKCPTLKSMSSVDLEKDALLEELEVAAKQTSPGALSLDLHSGNSCSMAPNQSLIGYTMKNGARDGKSSRHAMTRSSTGKDSQQITKSVKVVIPPSTPTRLGSIERQSSVSPAVDPVPQPNPTVSRFSARKQRTLEAPSMAKPTDMPSLRDLINLSKESEMDIALQNSGHHDEGMDEEEREFGEEVGEDGAYGGGEMEGHTGNDGFGAEEHQLQPMVQLDEEHYLSSEEADSETRSHGMEMTYHQDWNGQNGGMRDYELCQPKEGDLGQSADLHRPFARRTFGETLSSASLSEDERLASSSNNYSPLSRPGDIKLNLLRKPSPAAEMHTLELWREEIALAKERFVEDQERRRQEQDTQLARERFEREMAVQRLAFEAEQRDKDRDAETKRQVLQLKCQSDMQEMQIRAQQEQTRLMLEMIKLLRPPNGSL